MCDAALFRIKVTVQIIEQLSRQRCIQKTFKHFKIEHFAKRTIPKCRCATRKWGGGFAELGNLIKILSKTQGKEVPLGNILETILLLHTLKTTF